MTNAELVDLIQRRLRDDNGRQWSTEYIVDALNAAFSALCHVIPQAYTEHRDLVLAGGTEQQIDDDLHRIVHILHNKCPESGAAKRAIIKADLSIMDKVAPHWRQDDVRGYILHYLLNPIDESKFYVWPPAPEPIDGEVDAAVIRGVFTKTPCLIAEESTVRAETAPVLPAIPPEPVDPGPLGSGGEQVIPLHNTHVRDGGAQLLIDDLVGLPSANLRGTTIDILYDVSAFSSGSQSLYLNDTLPLTITARTYPADHTGSVFDVADVYENGTLLKLDDPRFISGETILRVTIPLSGNAAILEGIDIRDLPTTQLDIDTYNAELIAYNAAVAAYEIAYDELIEYLATDPNYVHSFPIAPIDSGNVGDGSNLSEVVGIYDAVVTQDPNNASSWILTMVDPSLSAAQGTIDGDYFIRIPDLSVITTNDPQVSLNQIIYPSYTSGGSLTSIKTSDTDTTPVRYNDLQSYEIIRVTRVGSNDWEISSGDDYDPGVLQSEVDAYEAEYAQYLIYIDVYQKYIDLIVASSSTPANALTLSDNFPFDKSHELAVQEFALYYALVRDDEHTANTGRAMQHWQNFYQLLNKREDAELLVKTAEDHSE